MAEFTKTETFLFLVLLLQVSEVRDEFIIRAGDEVTLPCGNFTADQSNCNQITWLVRYTTSSGTTLVEGGKLRDKFKGRMRVSESCSLTVNVTLEDAGRYECEQSGPGPYPQLDLSVVNLTEYRERDDVTLKCSVNKFERSIKHTVTWLYRGNPVEKYHPDFHVKSPHSDPWVTFKTYHFDFPSRFNLFKCRVKGDTGPEQEFEFRNQSSGQDTTSTTSTTTTKTTTSAPATTTTTTTENGTTSKPGASADQGVYIVVVVVLVALLIIVVVVVACWKIKVNKTKRNDNVADAEVSYATVSFNNTNSTHVRGGDDAVTYTTVKASSADPSNLYATLE